MRGILLGSALALAWISQSTAADFTVTNTSPSGSGSLQQAITLANSTPGADRIFFNIPGAGVHTIDVSQNVLPAVTESLVIDGYSQPGAKPNTLAIGSDAVILIEITGANATQPLAGLNLTRATAPGGGFLPSNYTVRGLSLTGFTASQTSFDMNCQASRTTHSYALSVGTVDSPVIAGNFIGLLPDGETARANYGGILCSTNISIGGTDPASRNIISGNSGYGISEFGVVQGNYIGTNASGTKAVPNAAGILASSGTVIGGTTTGSGNLISGNTEGIHLGKTTPFCFSAASPILSVGVRIQGNVVGLQPDRVTPLPNQSAIFIQYGSDTIIGGLEPGAGNLVAFNGSGIQVGTKSTPCRGCGAVSSPRNQVLSNSIFANGGLGIDIDGNGLTPNDPGDSDSGSNGSQNSPVIQNAQVANGSATITGTLNSTPNTQFTLQYFSESLDLVQKNQRYLGSNTVTTDGNGNAQFSATFQVSETNVAFNMTATGPEGTSEFSRNAVKLLNISTRSVVAGGDHVPIAGFIMRTHAIVVRVLGPSLMAGNAPLPGALSNPTLEIYNSAGGLIGSNDNWREIPAQNNNVEATGLGPPNNLEAALWMSLGPGSYTAVARGAYGNTGIAVLEVYDVGFGNGEIANISTRGGVGTGDDAMIAGFIVEPISGTSRIVARAIGPSLAASGVTDPLPDPVLELHNSQGAVIASNDNWRDGQQDALTAVGLAPTNDSESAIFMHLPSGAYTAVVRGKGNATGTAVVEMYDLH